MISLGGLNFCPLHMEALFPYGAEYKVSPLCSKLATCNEEVTF